MLLTGPFGGLTDDVREFLRCLADEGLPLTGWGDLDPAGLRTVRERLGQLVKAKAAADQASEIAEDPELWMLLRGLRVLA